MAWTISGQDFWGVYNNSGGEIKKLPGVPPSPRGNLAPSYACRTLARLEVYTVRLRTVGATSLNMFSAVYQYSRLFNGISPLTHIALPICAVDQWP
jgi:hypothetical protein